MKVTVDAPTQVVDQQKTRKADLLEKHDKLQKLIDTLADQDATTKA